MNFNLDIGTIVVAAIVGALSTFVTMWRTGIVLETKISQISETLVRFTAIVDRLSHTVDGMQHVHNSIENLFARVGTLEQQQAGQQARIEMLASSVKLT